MPLSSQPAPRRALQRLVLRAAVATALTVPIIAQAAGRTHPSTAYAAHAGVAQLFHPAPAGRVALPVVTAIYTPLPGTPLPTIVVPLRQLTVTPPTGVPSTLLTLNATPTSFPGNSLVTAFFIDPMAGNAPVPIGSIVSNSDGSLNVSFPSPIESTAGTATIRLDSGGTFVTSTFLVLPFVNADPRPVISGQTARIQGTGFAANASVDVTVGGQVFKGAGVTNARGSFTAAFPLPFGLPLGGSATATATDGVNSGSTSVNVSRYQGVPPVVAAATATPLPAIGLTPVAPATPVTGGSAAYFAEGYTGTAATNKAATFVEVLNLLNPNQSAATVVITYYIQGRAVPLTVERTVPANAVLRVPVNQDVGADALVGAAVVSRSPRLVASRTLTRVAADGSRLDSSTTVGAAAPSTSWGFPEGYTGVTFQEYLTLLNPGQLTATVQVALAPDAADATGTRTLSLVVPPSQRVTANISALNRGALPATQSVGLIATSDQPVVAERVLYFGDGRGSAKFGSTVSGGAPAPASQLSIAYGSSGGTTTDAQGALRPSGDQQFITLLNPSTSGAPVQVTANFAGPTGQQAGLPLPISVAPGTRKTIIANTALNAASSPFTVSLSASGPIQAEAAQYFGGSPNIGMHPGVAFPASPGGTDLLLSDLSTMLLDGTPITRTVYLSNPSSTAIGVIATYFGTTGATAPGTYTVPAGGVTAVDVNQAVTPSLGRGPIGAEFRLNAGSGPFLAYAVGRTADGRSATEDYGTQAP